MTRGHPPGGRHQGEVCPLHQDAQSVAEPMAPGGAAGGDARSGGTGPPWPRGGPDVTARPGLGGGQAVLDPLGDEEAPGRAPDVWGDLEEARKR